MICPICHEILERSLYVTTCGHAYHNDCITTWYAKHRTCPYCRREQYTNTKPFRSTARAWGWYTSHMMNYPLDASRPTFVVIARNHNIIRIRE